jgi:hypothetical protein
VEVARRLGLYLAEFETGIEAALRETTPASVRRVGRFATSLLSAIEFVVLPALRASGHHRFSLAAVVTYGQFKRRTMDLAVPSALSQPRRPLELLLDCARALRETCATTMNAQLVRLPRSVAADLVAEVEAGRACTEPLDTARARAMVNEARDVLELLSRSDRRRSRKPET